MNNELNALRQQHMDAELRIQTNSPYYTMISSFGVVFIVASTIILIFNGLTITALTIALLVMGIILLGGGSIWKWADEKTVKELTNRISIHEQKEKDAQRFSSVN